MGQIVEGAVISIHITFSNDFIPFLQEFYKIEKLKTSKLKRNPGLSVFPSMNTPVGGCVNIFYSGLLRYTGVMPAENSYLQRTLVMHAAKRKFLEM